MRCGVVGDCVTVSVSLRRCHLSHENSWKMDEQGEKAIVEHTFTSYGKYRDRQRWMMDDGWIRLKVESRKGSIDGF